MSADPQAGPAATNRVLLAGLLILFVTAAAVVLALVVLDGDDGDPTDAAPPRTAGPADEVATPTTEPATEPSTPTPDPTAEPATPMPEPTAEPAPSACPGATSPPDDAVTIGEPEDTLVAYPGPEWATVQAAVDGGYSEPAPLPGVLPSTSRSLTVHGSFDLNADSRAELVLGGIGNTARMVVILQPDGCALRPVLADDGSGEVFRLLVGIGGNSCAPIGCAVRTRCDGDDLVSTVIGPQQGDPSGSPETTPVMVTTTRYRMDGGRIELVETETTRFDSLPDVDIDVPALSESDQIDC